MQADVQYTTDVLVIGTGPMGATTALALARYGVKVHMVSRQQWLANSPRAHITNQRTMEVMRDLGVEQELYRYATPWNHMGDTMFTTSLAGEELIRIRSWGTGEERRGDYMQGSPCDMLDIIQPKMEPVLLKQAAESGATFAFNTEYLSHIQDEEGVTVTVRDRLTNHEYTIRAKYLVGADGAKSKVLDDLGLDLEGQLARAGTVYIKFRADLTAYVKHRPSILHWIVSPDAAFGEIGFGLLRAVEPWTEWIAGWGFDMSKGEPDISDDVVLAKIRALVGDPDLQPEILNKSLWYVNQAYAPVYSKGRVFCGGDAVHRHPPSSGLGMNTCVQDAFNLAWKLAYAVKGYAADSMLQSYSDERAPVGKQIVMRANQSRVEYAPLKAIFRVEGAENPVAAGIARFKDPGPEGVKARAAAQEALALKNTEFNAQGVEMNQRYMSAAVMADSAEEEVWQKDAQLYLQATTRPGAKIPHAWLVNANGEKCSTLDVTGKGYFTVVTGLAGQAWADAAAAMQLPFLNSVVTGQGNTQDPYCEWQRRREMAEAGAILVRPDGYVAWRCSKGVQDVSEARQQLATALSAILGKQYQ